MQHLGARSAFIQNCHLSSVIIELLPPPPAAKYATRRISRFNALHVLIRRFACADSTLCMCRFDASHVPIQRVASSLPTGRK